MIEYGGMSISSRSIKIFTIVVFVQISFIFMISSGNWRSFTLPFFKPSTEFRGNFSDYKIQSNNTHQLTLSKINDKSLENTFLSHLSNIKDTLFGNDKPGWHELPDKFERLNENPIYKPFNIAKAMKKEKIDIIFIVSSAPARLERRMAIRETWWPDCKSNSRISIKCVFLTDAKNANSSEGKDLQAENSKFNDLFFQNLEGGHDFGKRFLFHLIWAMQLFDFKYFQRIDDDYFLCMDRYLQEFPMPPKTMYHWGWVHCIKDIVRPEESIIVFSRDVVEIFLGQDPNKMLCHRWADQMVGVWHDTLKLPKLYHHDIRLHHDPPAQHIAAFKTEKDICTKFIGIHGAYPLQMRTLWANRGPNIYAAGKTFEDYAPECHLPSVMKWRSFNSAWMAEPKLCKDNPDWGGSHGTTYIGREGG